MTSLAIGIVFLDRKTHEIVRADIMPGRTRLEQPWFGISSREFNSAAAAELNYLVNLTHSATLTGGGSSALRLLGGLCAFETRGSIRGWNSCVGYQG